MLHTNKLIPHRSLLLLLVQSCTALTHLRYVVVTLRRHLARVFTTAFLVRVGHIAADILQLLLHHVILLVFKLHSVLSVSQKCLESLLGRWDEFVQGLRPAQVHDPAKSIVADWPGCRSYQSNVVRCTLRYRRISCCSSRGAPPEVGVHEEVPTTVDVAHRAVLKGHLIVPVTELLTLELILHVLFYRR